MALVRSPSVPLLELFNSLVGASHTLYTESAIAQSDMTKVAKKLLTLCKGADLAAQVFALGDTLKGPDDACAAQVVSFLNPHDPDLANPDDQRLRL